MDLITSSPESTPESEIPKSVTENKIPVSAPEREIPESFPESEIPEPVPVSGISGSIQESEILEPAHPVCLGVIEDMVLSLYVPATMCVWATHTSLQSSSQEPAHAPELSQESPLTPQSSVRSPTWRLQSSWIQL